MSFNNKLNLIKLTTPEELNKGLMFVKYLPKYEGRLFVFPNISNHTIWMKNTFISLDVIFLDQNFNIVDFVENTVPHSLETIGGNFNSKYVIEVNSGTIRNFNLKKNTNIINII
jgi:uncharacterized protein